MIYCTCLPYVIKISSILILGVFNYDWTCQVEFDDAYHILIRFFIMKFISYIYYQMIRQISLIQLYLQTTCIDI